MEKNWLRSDFRGWELLPTLAGEVTLLYKLKIMFRASKFSLRTNVRMQQWGPRLLSSVVMRSSMQLTKSEREAMKQPFPQFVMQDFLKRGNDVALVDGVTGAGLFYNSDDDDDDVDV